MYRRVVSILLRLYKPSHITSTKEATIKTLLFIAAAVAMLGIAGHMDQQTDLNARMSNTCQQSATEANRWIEQCRILINQVQEDPKAEVISDGSSYWVEYK